MCGTFATLPFLAPNNVQREALFYHTMNRSFSRLLVLLLLSTTLQRECEGFARHFLERGLSAQKSVVVFRESTAQQVELDIVDQDNISKLRFRQLQQACKRMGLPTTGTTGTLRTRLRDHICESQPGFVLMDDDGVDNEVCDVDLRGIEYTDISDPDSEYKELVHEITEKAKMGFWKAAIRKLKRLHRCYPNTPPREVYLETLQSCANRRLQGARAAEPARKIIEQIVEAGYELPIDLANACIQNTIGDGPQGTHDGFGGVDTALAMLAAMEEQSMKTGKEILTAESYSKVVSALIKESEAGSLDYALQLMRSMVVDKSMTPSLQMFADVAMKAATTTGQSEKVLTVLAYTKAAGFVLDTLASTADGRKLLAAGVIAAEQLNNAALGLRLLTSASLAQGCAPARGDDLVASSSSLAQRASTLIHKRAILGAVQDGNWKLAVKVLELMLERSLKPAPSIWRSVVTCCAKAEKSRKATALLLDWVKLSERGDVDKPPVSVFNTCVNVCEICDEQELTLVVLEAMKKTHDTDGNIITFNIALKRLAKQGNPVACEGIIIGMLQAGVEPTVVSYTTAIAACCASEPKNPSYAFEWLRRMRSRGVKPNVISYNTALAACLDGKLESSALASKIASEMLSNVEQEIQEEEEGGGELASAVPDVYTKTLARQLMQQLRQNWRSGAIDKLVATSTLRLPLLKLVEFQKSEVAAAAREIVKARELSKSAGAEEAEAVTERDEAELEYSTAASTHRVAEV